MSIPSPRPSFELDLARYELRRDGRNVPLERQPMELLILLVHNRERLITREEIVEQLWGKDVFVDTERGINNAIRKLRTALGDDSEHPRFIETVVGRGYRFVGPLPAIGGESAAEGPTDAQTPTRDSEAESRSRERSVRRIALLVVAVVGILAAAGLLIGKRAGLWNLLTRNQTGTLRSLAVLPFQNVSADSSQEYFANGMTDEITTELAQIGSMRVTSRTSTMQYKDASKPLPQIATELNVDAVVEGTVMRAGDRVRITAQLIQAKEDKHLWAKSYESDLRDVMELQREVARDIANQIRITLTPQEEQHFAAHSSIAPEIYDLYLQGAYHLNKGTEPEIKIAIQYFEQAISRDPNFARAYSGLSDSYQILSSYYWAPMEAMPKAKAAALKALELDESLSEAHTALGNVYFWYDWNWTAAQKEMKRALELNPNSASAHDLYAFYLAALGQREQSLAEIELSHELNPLSLSILADRVLCAFMVGDFDLAIENGEKAIKTEPNLSPAHAYLGLAYVQRHRFSDAVSEGEIAHHLDDSPLTTSFVAYTFAASGKPAEAGQLLEEIKAQRKEHYSCSYELANVYLALGQRDEGFHWLQDAYNNRSECMVFLRVDPRMESIHTDPRYQRLLGDAGFR
jgi:TolB-like protein/DNA-binding winged helix-turn-helix (wHTH) protein/Flp pilus assembly protein TadD